MQTDTASGSPISHLPVPLQLAVPQPLVVHGVVSRFGQQIREDDVAVANQTLVRAGCANQANSTTPTTASQAHCTSRATATAQARTRQSSVRIRLAVPSVGGRRRLRTVLQQVLSRAMVAKVVPGVLIAGLRPPCEVCVQWRGTRVTGSHYEHVLCGSQRDQQPTHRSMQNSTEVHTSPLTQAHQAVAGNRNVCS